MTARQRSASSNSACWRTHRRGEQPLRFRRLLSWGLSALLLILAPGLAPGQTALPDTVNVGPSSPRTLYLAEIQLSGSIRTPLTTVYRYLPLRPGQAIDQTTLVESVDELRTSGLFKSVSFYTRPGLERGRLVLVLEVVEHRLDFRWAAGNTDLDGWYLVPAMLAYDNVFGRGGLLDLQWQIGFRHQGLLLRYGQPRAGDGRNYWGTRFALQSTDRPYYSGGVEYRHKVGSSGLGGVFGRRFTDTQLLEFGLELEGVNVSHHSTAATGSEDGTIEVGQEIPEEDLPPSIQSVVGKDSRVILQLDWQHDTRAKEKRAGSPVGGIWGRVKGRLIGQKDFTHFGLQADLRAFKEMPGGVLATRLRAALVGQSAAFYDRLYLGGMYTVRGFPTNSLSAPGGDTWLWSGSVEYRSRILGDAKGTKLAGVFFVDAGASGSADEDDPYTGVAVGAGYGLRLRVWWLDWIGVDVGFPVTKRPIDMRFQGTASIGWSF